MPPSTLRPLARRRASVLALAGLVASTACNRPGDAHALTVDQPARVAELPREVSAETFATYEEFGFALLRRLTAAAPRRNAFISPASAGLALSMALEGAAGATHDSLAAMLGFGGRAPGEITRRNTALLRGLREAPEVTLAVANALWGQAGVEFDPAFVGRLRGDYGAGLAALDLSTPEALERINAWVNAATHGKVPEILDKAPPPEALLVLTNAVYFKGRWATEFAPDATAPRPFHLADGTTRDHPLMAQDGDFGNHAGEGCRLVRLPYRGGQLSMYVVLPDSGRTLPQITARLTAARFRAAVAAATPRRLDLLLPLFRLECTVDLTRPVAALGAANVFSSERADFSRLLAPEAGAPGRVFISRAFQRTFVEVNEEGTEAAAATAVEAVVVTFTPPPERFEVDRPFLVAIRHDPTGALLFLGQITDPAGGC